jgi:ribosomal protein S18 acetylase RimI-like enzyme
MYDLADVARGDALHVTDLPWRMTSPSAQVPDRTQLWEDANGELIAWAILQFPAWHCLDYVIRPDARSTELESTVLNWACTRLADKAADRDRTPFFMVSARDDDAARIAAIEQAGFVRQNWGYVHLVRDFDQPTPKSEPPSGFVIRPLDGEREVDAYVAVHRAAFETTNMSADWRRATLRDPRYVPDLDLVAIAPDGTLVGFCVCWIAPSLSGQRVAQVEPLGVLPEFQRTGLGRALLHEGLRRARESGAMQMDVKAESTNPASQGAYRAVGFRPVYEAPFFLRRFG